MSNRVVIGIVSLVQADERDLAVERLTDRDAALKAYVDFSTRGHPYARSPDEWVPFKDGTSIREFIKQTLSDFEVDFNSTKLDELRSRQDAALFVIDPLALLHRTKSILLVKIQQHICDSKKAFCIILPQDMPNPLRVDLENVCEADLRDLDDAAIPGSEFEVTKPKHLRRFLLQIATQLTYSGPNQAQSLNLAQLLSGAIPVEQWNRLQGMVRPPLVGTRS